MIKVTKIREIRAIRLIRDADLFPRVMHIIRNSNFGDTPEEALQELKLAWELVKEDCQQKGKEIPLAPVRRKLYYL